MVLHLCALIPDTGLRGRTATGRPPRPFRRQPLLAILAHPWVRLPLAAAALAWFAWEAWTAPLGPWFWVAAVAAGLAVLNAFRPTPEGCGCGGG